MEDSKEGAGRNEARRGKDEVGGEGKQSAKPSWTSWSFTSEKLTSKVKKKKRERELTLSLLIKVNKKGNTNHQSGRYS